jgi:hypothetical protein
MKLEIKHLAPYLPYKLEFLMESEPNSKEPNIDELKAIDTSIDMVNFGWGNAKTLLEIKPILKPLSKLSNDELIPIGLYIRDIEKCKATYKDNIFAVEDAKAWIKTGMKPVLSLLQTEGIMGYLFSIHADVFNLIENNLATELL